MLKSNWALESLPELVGTLSKIESFEGSWPVFWCSKVRKMTFWKKQVLAGSLLGVFNWQWSCFIPDWFLLLFARSNIGTVITVIVSLSSSRRSVLTWAFHWKKKLPSALDRKMAKKAKKEDTQKKQGMMTKTTRTTFLSFLAIFEDSTVICDSFHTFCCDRYDRQSETYRRTGTVTSLTTVSLNYYHCLLLPLDFAATSYNLQFCLESLGKNWQGRNNVPVSPHLTIGRN